MCLAKLVRLIPVLLVLLPGAAGCATGPGKTTLENPEKFTVIDAQLHMYRRAFPEIVFVHARGGERWRDDFVAIVALLGEAPSAMDYGHPPEFRGDVMDVSMQFMAFNLQQNIVSASLFRTDVHGVLKGMPLCVLTLNPDGYADTSLAATTYMLNLPEHLAQRIHPSRLLDPRDQLRYTVDHEVFHCLDSMRLGGAPMTTKRFGGEYNQFLRESGADAFALAMHLQKQGASSLFAQNLCLVQALWLTMDGPNRNTFESVYKVYRQPESVYIGKTVTELFELADKVRKEAVGSYEFYLGQRAAEIQAAQALGYEPSDFGDDWARLAERPSDPKRVAYKIERLKHYYTRLFGGAPIEFRSSEPAQR